jgi:hypothetical protein
MQSITGEPENDAAPPNPTQCGQNEACHLFPGRPLPIPKSPIFIQEKTVGCAKTVGYSAENQDHPSTVGRKQQQQHI